MDFKKELNDRINYIEEIINNNLIDENSKKDDLQYQIYEAMNYSVMSGGKRLRPMLLLETSRLFGGADEDTFPFMTAIELIHTYSLVHDDLEAMDNDEYRRGKKTTHAVYGEAMGVLCGDALLNYAFEIGLDGIKKASDKNLAIDSLSILSEKAGVFGMIGGQVVDIKNDGKKIDINTLDYINELKTGALIEAAMTMGATLAGASKEEITLVNECASMIGQAFQIQDDILDVTSTTEVLGKPVLSDEKNNKSTYVNLLGIEEAGNKVEELSNHAIERLKSLGRENEFLFILIEKLINRNK
ncbi:MAG: polyprenyl synthetase family protein [Lachnospiraceae bacterium]|nr:polyprenyl synthetase family protein [Lachnospiraceae bacterium]